VGADFFCEESMICGLGVSTRGRAIWGGSSAAGAGLGAGAGTSGVFYEWGLRPQ